MVVPMLAVRKVLVAEFERLHPLLLSIVRSDATCNRMMTTPSIGPVTALAYVSGIDDPSRFKASQAVGAHFGMTPRRYQSGEMDFNGRISKCGDALVRTALYEAATVLLTRVKQPSSLRDWGCGWQRTEVWERRRSRSHAGWRWSSIGCGWMAPSLRLMPPKRRCRWRHNEQKTGSAKAVWFPPGDEGEASSFSVLIPPLCEWMRSSPRLFRLNF